MISMPNMGVKTNLTTTSSSTWIWCLIANIILMLMTKVTKNNLDVIFETTHDTTIMEEEILNMIKTKKVTMDVIKNLHNLINDPFSRYIGQYYRSLENSPGSEPFILIWTSLIYAFVIPKIPLPESGLFEPPYLPFARVRHRLGLFIELCSKTSGTISYIIKAYLVDI
jgi:hypothetical protein